jgi:adenosylcobinamide kinase/adenosylcobinamide-phosphate guanylyltransferase
MRTLVLGGVRSGKSRYAEALAREVAGPIAVVATGTALDEEMAVRIAAHRANRPSHWCVIEEPIYLSGALIRADAALPTLPGTQILVGSEVGLGIMPIIELARRFGDEAGVLHQRLAPVCDRVVLMVAGLPLTVKDRMAGDQPSSRIIP